jgi:hypothetical protein
MALAESQLREQNVDVLNPLALNAVDPCLFAYDELLKTCNDEDDDFVGVVSTSRLVYNANPSKLGYESIRSAAKKLSRLELEREAISERMASANYMLTAICRSVSGGYEIDESLLSIEPARAPCRRMWALTNCVTPLQACWASFVLIVYLCSDPRGRPLLRETNLTDLDVQTACAFEAYGRGEVTRRARLRAQQEEEARKAAESASKKRRSNAPSLPAPSTAAGNNSDSDEWDAAITFECGAMQVEDDTASIANDDDVDSGDEPDLAAAAAVNEPMPDWMAAEENADQKVLATKRKRASKGYANASTADAHGIMVW